MSIHAMIVLVTVMMMNELFQKPAYSSCPCRINRNDPAAIAGGYASWTTPYSYNAVREMQLAIGLLSNGSCLRSGQLEELINCEAGQIKLPPNRLKDRCIELNLACPDVSFGHTTKPCPTSLHWDSSQYSIVLVGIT